jgi:hypothetical protein
LAKGFQPPKSAPLNTLPQARTPSGEVYRETCEIFRIDNCAIQYAPLACGGQGKHMVIVDQVAGEPAGFQLFRDHGRLFHVEPTRRPSVQNCMLLVGCDNIHQLQERMKY